MGSKDGGSLFHGCFEVATIVAVAFDRTTTVIQGSTAVVTHQGRDSHVGFYYRVKVV